MEYLVHILILILVYSILSVSLNLLAGHTGMLSVAHAAFFGIGAYVTAIAAIRFECAFATTIVLAVPVSCVLGLLVGASSIRFREDYFVIATFAFQVIAFGVFNNCVSLTGGPMGLPGIPRPIVFGWPVSSCWGFLAMAVLAFGGTLWISHRMVACPFGRMLNVIREDEVFAKAVGKKVALVKVKVLVVAAGMAAVGGCLYAYYISFIDPTSFTAMESILILSIVIVGGAGSQWGPVLGAVVLVTLPELLRFVGLPGAIAANVRQILYGLALVGFMVWRPQGLIGENTFDRRGGRV